MRPETDPARLREVYERWPTDRLIRAVALEREEFCAGTLEVIELVLDTRGVTAAERREGTESTRAERALEGERLIGGRGLLLLFVVSVGLAVLGNLALAVAAVLVGIVVLLAVVVFVVHLARPDLLRFEHVVVTARPAVFDALDARLASLEEKSHSELQRLPEERVDRTQLDGREVVFDTTRAQLENGDVRVVVLAGVKEKRHVLSRSCGVAARGFRMTASGVRTPLTEHELESLAMQLGSRPLYAR